MTPHQQIAKATARRDRDLVDLQRWSSARRPVTSEVACSLRLAERTAENLLAESSMFAGPMALALTALSRGEISYRHAQVLLEKLSFIPLEKSA